MLRERLALDLPPGSAGRSLLERLPFGWAFFVSGDDDVHDRGVEDDHELRSLAGGGGVLRRPGFACTPLP
jgi:hypothetical protein